MTELLSWTADADNKIIPRLLALHSPCADPRILDVCCNRRYMWRETGYTPLGCDIDPGQHPNVVADCRALPFAAGSWDVVVFDPPHVPGEMRFQRTAGPFVGIYGIGSLPTAQKNGVRDLFAPFLSEAARVLAPGGVVLAKLADGVYEDGYQWHHVDYINAARVTPGLRMCDQVIKIRPCAATPTDSRQPRQYHHRAAHSYWLVVRKGGCQGRGLARPVRPQQAVLAW